MTGAKQTNKQTEERASKDKLVPVYLNGVQLTEHQADTLSDALNNLYEEQKKVLNKIVSEYKSEIEKLPQIFKIRIEALREVNPEKFCDSPELILSSLTAVYLIKGLQPIVPKNFKSIPFDKIEYEQAHEKYGISFGDVNPALVSEMVWAYFTDIKNNAIDEDGNVINITKSKLMTVFHGWKENGIPMDAKNTIAKYIKKDMNTKPLTHER